MKKLFACICLLIIVLGCKEAVASEEVASVSMAAPMENKDKMVDATVEETAPTETQIIRTSNLRFETDNLTDSYQNIQKAIVKHKGTLQNDASGKDYGSTFRNLTIRIPNTSFIPFLDEISKGVNHFDRKEISSQDVTEQYIDLESRMLSKKTLEKRYLQLLQKANKVTEIIEIEGKLAEIREEIEAKEGQFRYLKNQISMSTVTIEMYTNDASQSGTTSSFGGKIWNEIKSGFNGLSRFILGIISIWPFLIISILIFIFIKRKFKKKTQ
ncbi:DUF4349 domain-containing protein [Flavobacterium sp.]|uniref:DUF4349 domain-containing protein n=1 Tax=Flavobacterium sp. TaxID=239 RepID=UPI00286DFF36|nr:DUF4349 domain-containing protein [Flavobacterium sp.]